MKRFLSALTVVFLLSSSFNFPPRQGVVLEITETTPYCGGANPGEDILKKATEKKIALGQVFYIIKGNTNTSNHIIVDSFKVDKTGTNCISLKPGNYALINAFSYTKLVINDTLYDRECLKQLWSTPLAVFKIKNNTCDTIRHNIEQPCPYNLPCKKLSDNVPM